MRPTAIHQFVPTLEPGGVGNHLLEVQRLARELGFESEVFSEHFHPRMLSAGHDFRQYGRRYPNSPADVLVYQTAIGSTVADFVLGQRGTIAVNYHNITPVRFLASWEPGIVHGITWGRAQLAAMAARAALGIPVSLYNEAELIELGYRQTTVVPVLVDLSSFDAQVDEVALDRLQRAGDGGRSAWLFVGRITPNKAQHDLIKAFAVYRRIYDPQAVLRIVGASSSSRYLLALRHLIDALGMEEVVELTGAVSAGELAAHYRAADVFVCLSDHEGFCVPLLEAMHHRLPVVAFAAGAVPETLGSAGLCLPAKSPSLVAAAVARMLGDEALRTQFLVAGIDRLTEFDLAVTRRRMASTLQDLVAR